MSSYDVDAVKPPSLHRHPKVATSAVQTTVETTTTGCDSEEPCMPQHIFWPPLEPPPQLPFPHVKAVLKKPLCYLPPGTWLNLRIKKGETVSLVSYLTALRTAKFYRTGLTYISASEQKIVAEAFSQSLEAATASLASTFFEKLPDFVTKFDWESLNSVLRQLHTNACNDMC